MLKLGFNWRDILRAPRLALSLQRMWIQLVGLTLGLLFYLLLTYLGLMAAGYSLKTAWMQNGLLPCFFAIGDQFPWYSWLLTGIGSLVLVFSLMITNTAVSRAIYMTSKGNSFYSWKESFAFAFRKTASILLTPISLLVLIGFMVLGALIIGLLAKIPFIGALGFSLFTVVWILGALILIFFCLATLVATLLVPSVLATTDEDAFEAIFQSFSIVWSRPWRFIFYEGLTIILSILALGGMAFFMKQALFIVNYLFAVFIGGNFVNLANNGQALLQGWTLLAQGLVDKMFGQLNTLVFFSREFLMVGNLPLHLTISSALFALSLLFIGGWVVSYAMSTFTAGNTLLFLVIKKVKDDENLLERKDAEEESEEEETEEKSEENSATSDVTPAPEA